MTRLLFQSLFIEFIANTSEREYPFRFAVVLFDRFSQAANVDIDCARSDIGFSAPDPIEQLIAAQHPVGILDQKSQKLKFF